MLNLNRVQNTITISHQTFDLLDKNLYFGLKQLNNVDFHINPKQGLEILKINELQFSFIDKMLYLTSIKLYFSHQNNISIENTILNEDFFDLNYFRENFSFLERYEELCFEFQECLRDEFGWLYLFELESNKLVDIQKTFNSL